MTISWRRPVGRLALAAASTALAAAAAAQVVRAGVELPARMSVGGQTLALTSCGVRETLWLEHYVAALYLRASQPVATGLRDPQEPKMILMHVVRGASLPERIPEQWREPLREELQRDPLAGVQAAYGKLGSGDRVQLTYVPREGVTIRVGDRVVATTPGHDLIGAMLDTWAGADPLSGKLQRLLLEHPC